MFGFVMGHLQHLDLSSKTLSFHQRAFSSEATQGKASVVADKRLPNH